MKTVQEMNRVTVLSVVSNLLGGLLPHQISDDTPLGTVGQTAALRLSEMTSTPPPDKAPITVGDLIAQFG